LHLMHKHLLRKFGNSIIITLMISRSSNFATAMKLF
jgi:hypothetical protein